MTKRVALSKKQMIAGASGVVLLVGLSAWFMRSPEPATDGASTTASNPKTGGAQSTQTPGKPSSQLAARASEHTQFLAAARALAAPCTQNADCTFVTPQCPIAIAEAKKAEADELFHSDDGRRACTVSARMASRRGAAPQQPTCRAGTCLATSPHGPNPQGPHHRPFGPHARGARFPHKQMGTKHPKPLAPPPPHSPHP